MIIKTLILLALVGQNPSEGSTPPQPNWWPTARLELEWKEKWERNHRYSGPLLFASAGVFPTWENRWRLGIEVSTAGESLDNENPGRVELSNGSSQKSIGLSQAYLGGSYRWKALEMSLQLGKFENPVFNSPLVWDFNLHPEGGAESIDINFGDNFQLAIYGAQYSIDQVSASLTNGTPVRRSWMFQQGVLMQFAFPSDISARIGINSVIFTRASERLAKASSRHGNTLNNPASPTSKLKESLWPMEAHAEVRAIPIGIETVLKGAFIINFQTDDQQRGFYVATAIGNSWRKGNLFAEATYFYLEPDASLALLADHRFGNANRKGPRFELSYFYLDALRVGSHFLYAENLKSNLDQAARKEWGFEVEYRF